MKLIIAEKPELGRDIAKAILHTSNEHNGVISNNDYTVTWAYGHLLELQEPEVYEEKYKIWNEQDLPIYFEDWKKVPAKDICDKSGTILLNNKYKRDRLKVIGDLLLKTDYVIHAGDPDEEGQNLIDELLEYFNFNGIVKRVLINDNIEKNIVKSFEELKDNCTLRAISDSAYARQMTDKSHGINHSRLATIRLKQTGLSIGRVQTATLGLVVNRDEAIENHVKLRYYDLEALCNLKNEQNEYLNILFKFKPSKDLLGENKHILDKDILDDIAHLLESTYMCDTIIKEVRTSAPLPFNQTLLSAEMNRLYGYSLKQTLDITQALREKHKAITYNRSDSQYLKFEHFKEAPTVTKQIMSNLSCDYPLDFIDMPECFNDEYAPTHHGIIPQEREINLSDFTCEERNVYVAIAKRYLMQFLPASKANISASTIHVNGGVFVHSSSYITDKGWKQYFSNTDVTDDENEPQGEFINNGKYQTILLKKDILEKETKPLRKYTEGSLVKDMTSISKYVHDPKLKQALKDKDKGKKGENGSIGTVATRGSIFETLLKRNFLVKEGKNIVSTSLGKEFYHLIPNEIKTADVTARWWLIQEEIKTGEKDVNELMLEDIREFLSIKDTAYLNAVLSERKDERKSVGNCPICSSSILEGSGNKGKSWYCSAYKSGCSFRLYENTKRFNDIIKLTTSKVRKLLDGGKIECILTSKEGKPYAALLKLNTKNGYANLDLDGFVNKKK